MKLPPFLLLVDAILALVSQIQSVTVGFGRIATCIVMSIIRLHIQKKGRAPRQIHDEHQAQARY